MKIVSKKFEVVFKGNRYIRELYHDGTYQWFWISETDTFVVEKAKNTSLEAKFLAAWFH